MFKLFSMFWYKYRATRVSVISPPNAVGLGSLVEGKQILALCLKVQDVTATFLSGSVQQTQI